MWREVWEFWQVQKFDALYSINQMSPTNTFMDVHKPIVFENFHPWGDPGPMVSSFASKGSHGSKGSKGKGKRAEVALLDCRSNDPHAKKNWPFRKILYVPVRRFRRTNDLGY